MLKNERDVTQLKIDSDKTNFKKVSNFNKVFGADRYDTPQPNVFNKNPKLVELRLGLIREEVKELEEAVKAHDFVEVVDALADILYVVYGAGDCFGVDLDEVYQIVHSSNMTKMCTSEDEAIKTVEWYRENKADVYPTPAYKQASDGIHWIVFNESTGKVLKSINYLPTDLKKYAVTTNEEPSRSS
jgi:predicted HAD superfamily Cof-like phosphohydrolase